MRNKTSTRRQGVMTIALLCLAIAGFCQTNNNARRLGQLADSLYRAKDYLAATSYYLQHAAIADFRSSKASSLYNAACCLGLQKKNDSALLYLKKAIAAGYANKTNLVNDNDLVSLHNSKEWAKIKKGMKEDIAQLNEDPRKAKFITEDIHRFWRAYDKAYADTANFDNIFRKEYFAKSTRGMDDYMSIKVSDVRSFTRHIKSAPRFYKSIRSTTLKIDSFKNDFRIAFQKMKDIYPPAKFPDVYFVIGAFSSAGTVSRSGLLIGVNQISKLPETPIEEIHVQLRTRLLDFQTFPNVIAHELVHFQQNGIVKDTITLGYAIVEGMADFIAELISGDNANPALYKWAQGKEKAIWNRFKNDMYYDRYNNWIANSSQATPDHLPDQGYWVGYQICKSYYERATDKKKAINDMFNIKDFRKFLQESGWEEKVNSMK